MTRNDAYKSFKCWHCPFLDSDEGECLGGDPESDECPRYADEGGEDDA